jgi:succinyl-CoA synthetase beta subunit
VDQALGAAAEIGYPVVIKSQVLVGGRGLAGGIRVAESDNELKDHVEALLKTTIKGLPVKELLIVKKEEILKELYTGVTINGFSGKPAIVVSTEGGIDVEKSASRSRQHINILEVEPGSELYPYQARSLLRRFDIPQKLLIQWTDIIVKLYRIFTHYEALIVEINPLVELKNGKLMALDAVIELDNSALFRRNISLPGPIERMEDPLEKKGKQIGVTYVNLDGDIAIISSGAGLGMASMDIIAQRLKPANFLETGGGITEELLYKCMELVTSKNHIKAVFINIYGGINPIHEGAKGIARYIKEKNLQIPVVAKALGNRQEETWEILRSAGVHVVTETATEVAVERLFELVNGK